MFDFLNRLRERIPEKQTAVREREDAILAAVIAHPDDEVEGLLGSVTEKSQDWRKLVRSSIIDWGSPEAGLLFWSLKTQLHRDLEESSESGDNTGTPGDKLRNLTGKLAELYRAKQLEMSIGEEYLVPYLDELLNPNTAEDKVDTKQDPREDMIKALLAIELTELSARQERLKTTITHKTGGILLSTLNVARITAGVLTSKPVRGALRVSASGLWGAHLILWNRTNAFNKTNAFISKLGYFPKLALTLTARASVLSLLYLGASSLYQLETNPDSFNFPDHLDDSIVYLEAWIRDLTNGAITQLSNVIEASRYTD